MLFVRGGQAGSRCIYRAPAVRRDIPDVTSGLQRHKLSLVECLLGHEVMAVRYLFENFTFDTDRRELRRGAEMIALAPQVFDLLDYLIRNRERVVSKDDLIRAIWDGRAVSDAALTTRLNAVPGRDRRHR
jgi:DNA-binding response OmpR family regulator